MLAGTCTVVVTAPGGGAGGANDGTELAPHADMAMRRDARAVIGSRILNE